MSVVVSVLTPDWALQVCDAPGGCSRTVVLPGTTRGLLSWAGDLVAFEALLPDVLARADRDPAELAKALAALATAVDTDASALHVGWGPSSADGRDTGFRYLTTNFEHDDASDGVGWRVYGGTVSEHDPRLSGKRASTSYSIQVSTTVDLPRDAVRGIEALPRDIQRRRPVTDLALSAAEVVRVAVPGAPVLLALLHRDGTLEGGLLVAGAMAPLAAGTGARRLGA